MSTSPSPANENSIANSMDNFMRLNGYVCGRNFANATLVARGIRSDFPSESEANLARKILEIANERPHEFKRRGVDEVSASRTSDPDCGT